MSLVFEINRTILRNQNLKLTEGQAAEALAACPKPGRLGLARARLELACWLSDCWPMTICEEVAAVLMPGPGETSEQEDPNIPEYFTPLATLQRARGR